MRITLIIGLFSFYFKLECFLWSLETAEWRPATKTLFQWCCHFQLSPQTYVHTLNKPLFTLLRSWFMVCIMHSNSVRKKNFGCFYSILLYHSMFIIMMKHQNHCYSYTDSSLLNMFTYLCHSMASPPRESVCSPSVVMPKSCGIPILCFRHKATRHMYTLCCTRLPKRSKNF